MADGYVSPEYRIDGRGVALERCRQVEQYRKEGRIFYRERGTRGGDPALVCVSTATSRFQPGRWKWLVPVDGWRHEIVLEEQSVPDKSFHGRGRRAPSAMGHDRSGRESGRQCDPDRLGQSLRPPLRRAILDRHAGAVLRRNHERDLANLSAGIRYGRKRRH